MSNSGFSLTPDSFAPSYTEPEVKPDLTAERKRSALSRSAGWKDMIEFLEQREDIYSRQMPGGEQFKYMNHEDAGFYACVANAVIEELRIWRSRAEGISGGPQR